MTSINLLNQIGFQILPAIFGLTIIMMFVIFRKLLLIFYNRDW